MTTPIPQAKTRGPVTSYPLSASHSQDSASWQRGGPRPDQADRQIEPMTVKGVNGNQHRPARACLAFSPSRPHNVRTVSMLGTKQTLVTVGALHIRLTAAPPRRSRLARLLCCAYAAAAAMCRPAFPWLLGRVPATACPAPRARARSEPSQYTLSILFNQTYTRATCRCLELRGRKLG